MHVLDERVRRKEMFLDLKAILEVNWGDVALEG
jgi:hypothetical protein